MGIIRILLALVVLFGHSSLVLGLHTIVSSIAVQAFYVISGFYMALVLNEKYARSGRGYREFLGQRLLRLLPAYWVCLGLSILVGAMGWGTILPQVGETPPFTYWQQHAAALPLYQWVFLVFNQLSLLGQDWMLFLGLSPAGSLAFVRDFHGQPNPPYHFLFVSPAWSLGVELSFYLVAPFLVRRRWWVIAAWIVGSLLVRLTAWRLLQQPGEPPFQYLLGDPWGYRFFPSELGTFLLGALGYRFYAWARARKLDMRPFGWAALLIIVLAVFAFSRGRGLWLPLLLPMALVPIGIPFVFALTKNWKVDRWIGELSYPIYIVHAIVGAVLTQHLYGAGKGVVPGKLLLLWTIPTAIVIRLVVEQPIDRWRQHLRTARHHEPAEVISPAPM